MLAPLFNILLNTQAYKNIMTKENIKTKRAYERPLPEDGKRILVDRLWPRGKTKKDLKIDEWLKDISPSLGLIKWFGHDPEKWPEFKKKYKAELKAKKDLLSKLKEFSQKGPLTLVYSAKDQKHNNAVVLKEMLQLNFR